MRFFQRDASILILSFSGSCRVNSVHQVFSRAVSVTFRVLNGMRQKKCTCREEYQELKFPGGDFVTSSFVTSGVIWRTSPTFVTAKYAGHWRFLTQIITSYSQRFNHQSRFRYTYLSFSAAGTGGRTPQTAGTDHLFRFEISGDSISPSPDTRECGSGCGPIVSFTL